MPFSSILTTPCGPQVLSTFHRILHRLSQSLLPFVLPFPGAEPSESPSDCWPGPGPGPPASESPARPRMCASSWGPEPLPVSVAGNYDGPEPAGWTGWEAPCRSSDDSSTWSGAPSAAGTPMLIVAAGWGSRAGESYQLAPSAPSGLMRSGPGLNPAHGIGGPGPGL